MLNKLRTYGIATFKRTSQRLAIIEHLAGNTSHPSAEEIFRAVSKKNPAMSFATVYNTLNMLVQAGVIRELTIDPERKRYDPDTSSHHHLMCSECRKVVDIMAAIPVEVPKGLAGDFAITGSSISFSGTCGPCRRRKRKK